MLKEAGSVLIKESVFESNSVNSTSVLDTDSDGGAILFACDPTKTDKDCSVTLEANLFKDNFAKNKGGALRFVNTNFTFVYLDQNGSRRLQTDSQGTAWRVNTNVFAGNRASQGSDLASYPAFYRYKFEQETKLDVNDVKSSFTFAPGQTMKLRIEIFDTQGMLYTNENKAVCSVVFDDPESLPQYSDIQNGDSVA